MQKIRIIELLFENTFYLADLIAPVTIYGKHLGQKLSATPYLKFQ